MGKKKSSSQKKKESEVRKQEAIKKWKELLQVWRKERSSDEKYTRKKVCYIDGSCLDNINRGACGSAAVYYPNELNLVSDTKHFESSTWGFTSGTNNIGELNAFEQGLTLLKKHVGPNEEWHLFTDSEYVIGQLQNGKNAMENVELICRLKTMKEQCIDEYKLHGIMLHYIPGHKGVYGNEKADELASKEAKKHEKTTNKPKDEKTNFDEKNIKKRKDDNSDENSTKRRKHDDSNENGIKKHRDENLFKGNIDKTKDYINSINKSNNSSTTNVPSTTNLTHTSMSQMELLFRVTYNAKPTTMLLVFSPQNKYVVDGHRQAQLEMKQIFDNRHSKLFAILNSLKSGKASTAWSFELATQIESDDSVLKQNMWFYNNSLDDFSLFSL